MAYQRFDRVRVTHGDMVREGVVLGRVLTLKNTSLYVVQALNYSDPIFVFIGTEYQLEYVGHTPSFNPQPPLLPSPSRS